MFTVSVDMVHSFSFLIMTMQFARIVEMIAVEISKDGRFRKTGGDGEKRGGAGLGKRGEVR